MTQPQHLPIRFIGGGNMARSLVGGLLARGSAPASIHVAEPHRPLREALARDFSVDVHAGNDDAAKAGAVWVFATKPQVLRSVAEALAPIAQQARPLVISIAAGITSTQLERWLGGNLAVVRAMPNTPALLGAGATGLFANTRVTPEQHALADRLMAATGLTAWIPDESQMDAVTGLSGSGPAYVFLLAEAMQAAGEAQGLDTGTSRTLALRSP